MLRKSTYIIFLLFATIMLLGGCNVDVASPENSEEITSLSLAEVEEPTIIPEPERPMPKHGPDADGDWVSDVDEEKYGSDPLKWDTDDDGATDFEEIFIVGSDPAVFDGDTDEDFLRDVTEEFIGSDPHLANQDRDLDGIPDLIELQLGSDPGLMDTDGDMLSDYLELFLTETDPASPDPITANGYPEPLVEWLPEQLREVKCEVAVVFTMDEIFVPNPEEADSPSDIILGDDTYIKYGLWTGMPADAELVMEENTANTAVWFGKAETGTRWDRTQFRVLNPVITECGDTVTLAVQALEDDSPWGGIWDMGVWRDDLPLVFNRLPFGWWHTRQDGFYFFGETHDSDYRYEFTYSFAVQLLSSITSREDVQATYKEQFGEAPTTQSASTNPQDAQNMIFAWMLLGLLDSSTGTNTVDSNQNCPKGIDGLTGRCLTHDEAGMMYQWMQQSNP